METDRLAWLLRLTRACDDSLADLEKHDGAGVDTLKHDIQELRNRLQAELDGAS